MANATEAVVDTVNWDRDPHQRVIHIICSIVLPVLAAVVGYGMLVWRADYSPLRERSTLFVCIQGVAVVFMLAGAITRVIYNGNQICDMPLMNSSLGVGLMIIPVILRGVRMFVIRTIQQHIGSADHKVDMQMLLRLRWWGRTRTLGGVCTACLVLLAGVVAARVAMQPGVYFQGAEATSDCSPTQPERLLVLVATVLLVLGVCVVSCRLRRFRNDAFFIKSELQLTAAVGLPTILAWYALGVPLKTIGFRYFAPSNIGQLYSVFAFSMASIYPAFLTWNKQYANARPRFGGSQASTPSLETGTTIATQGLQPARGKQAGRLERQGTGAPGSTGSGAGSDGLPGVETPAFAYMPPVTPGKTFKPGRVSLSFLQASGDPLTAGLKGTKSLSAVHSISADRGGMFLGAGRRSKRVLPALPTSVGAGVRPMGTQSTSVDSLGAPPESPDHASRQGTDAAPHVTVDIFTSEEAKMPSHPTASAGKVAVRAPASTARGTGPGSWQDAVKRLSTLAGCATIAPSQLPWLRNAVESAVAHNSLELWHVLYVPSTRALLKAYLQLEFSAENLLFLVDSDPVVLRTKAQLSGRTAAQITRGIIEQYVRDGAAYQVNLPHGRRQTLIDFARQHDELGLENLHKSPLNDKNAMKRARKTVYALLESDSWLRFKDTDGYATAVNRIKALADALPSPQASNTRYSHAEEDEEEDEEEPALGA